MKRALRAIAPAFLFAVAAMVIAGLAAAAPVAFHPAAGPPNPIGPGRDVCWSEPPDLNGLIGSSEIIEAVGGLVTEIANDFVPTGGVSHVDWGGGFYSNTTPCSSGISTPGFNLYFYDDGGCVPGTLIASNTVGIGQFTESSLGCQAGFYPLFQWGADAYAPTVAGNLYWFGVQMTDHAFPPQGGRLAAAEITGCDGVFKSAFFGFPDWTPTGDVFGVAMDASQEMPCCCGPAGACCFSDGHCEDLDATGCEWYGGVWQGAGTECSSNPCGPTAVRTSSWGEIRALYR